VRKLTKIALAAKISKGAIGRRDVVMIGDFNEIAALESRDLLAFFGAGEINRFTLSREDDDPSGRLSSDTRIINSVANFVRRHDSREILLALPWGDTSRIEFVRDQIKGSTRRCAVVTGYASPFVDEFQVFGASACLSHRNSASALSAAQRFAKRSMDIFAGALALVFFLPLMVLTAIAIKLDGPGPVIFRQSRKGFNGEEFVIFKFRTMTVQENGPAVVQRPVMMRE
jgi:hypothetical protein